MDNAARFGSNDENRAANDGTTSFKCSFCKKAVDTIILCEEKHASATDFEPDAAGANIIKDHVIERVKCPACSKYVGAQLLCIDGGHFCEIGDLSSELPQYNDHIGLTTRGVRAEPTMQEPTCSKYTESVSDVADRIQRTVTLTDFREFHKDGRLSVPGDLASFKRHSFFHEHNKSEGVSGSSASISTLMSEFGDETCDGPFLIDLNDFFDSKFWTYCIVLGRFVDRDDTVKFSLYAPQYGRFLCSVLKEHCDYETYKPQSGSDVVRWKIIGNEHYVRCVKFRVDLVDHLKLSDKLMSITALSICGHVGPYDKKIRPKMPIWCDLVGLVMVDVGVFARLIRPNYHQPEEHLLTPLRLAYVKFEAAYRMRDDSFAVDQGNFRVTSIKSVDVDVRNALYPRAAKRLDDLTLVSRSSDCVIFESRLFATLKICAHPWSFVDDALCDTYTAIIVPHFHAKQVDYWLALMVGPKQLVAEMSHDRLFNFKSRTLPSQTEQRNIPPSLIEERMKFARSLGL